MGKTDFFLHTHLIIKYFSTYNVGIDPVKYGMLLPLLVIIIFTHSATQVQISMSIQIPQV